MHEVQMRRTGAHAQCDYTLQSSHPSSYTIHSSACTMLPSHIFEGMTIGATRTSPANANWLNARAGTIVSFHLEQHEYLRDSVDRASIYLSPRKPKGY